VQYDTFFLSRGLAGLYIYSFRVMWPSGALYLFSGATSGSGNGSKLGGSFIQIGIVIKCSISRIGKRYLKGPHDPFF